MILAAGLATAWCDGSSVAAAQGYDDTIAPFLKQHCVKCHGPEKPKAQLMLHKLTGKLADEGEARVWASIVERLQAGDMPPKGEGRPAADAQGRVIAWVRQEAEKAQLTRNTGGDILPAKGNLIDHDLLYSSKAKDPAASPARVWRLRHPAYEEHVSRLLGQPFHVTDKRQADFSSPWGFTSTPGFKDYAALYRIDEPETDLLISNALAVASRLVAGRQSKTRKAPSPLAAFTTSSGEPTLEQIHPVVQYAFGEVLRRHPNPEELEKYAGFLERTGRRSGRAKALQLMLAAILLRPDSVFRFELGQGNPDAHGRIMLAPRELAYAIAFALTEKEPDEQLRQAADSGKLTSKDEVARQVSRILNDQGIAKPRILEFFREYFEYPACVEVFKDADERKKAGIGGDYRPRIMVYDTDRLVEHIVAADSNVLVELLTSKKTYVSAENAERWLASKSRKPDETHPYKSGEVQIYRHYSITPEQWTHQQPFELPAEQRAGILTQPSWLIAHSTNFENHAIERGKWIRERLLGGSLPDVPITVEAKLPDDPHKALRDRMQVTRQAFCWQCHQKMDPLGLTFEMFDHFGQFRSTELGKPVDTTGSVIGSGDARLDGPVLNAIDLMKKLAASERVEQVFVRHAFRYWMGRNETLADAAVLQEAQRDYRGRGGSMRALLHSLLTSDAFLYRYVPR
jgi:hypothetical protein